MTSRRARQSGASPQVLTENIGSCRSAALKGADMRMHANIWALENLCVRTVGKRFLLERNAAEQLYEICRMSRPATDNRIIG
jgi:Na+/phosphate symporter